MQLQLILLHNLSMGIFQTGIQPLTYKLRNRIEICNELMVQIATLHMCLFTDWVVDVK